MKRYKQLLIKYFDEMLAGIFAMAAAVFLFVGLSFRIFFVRELFWTQEAVQLCFVWTIFLGIAAVYKRRIHIGADMLVRMLPTVLKQKVSILVHLCLSGINVYLFWLSMNYLFTSAGERFPVLGISYAWLSAAMVLCFGLCSWYSLCDSFREQRNIRIRDRKREKRKEGI